MKKIVILGSGITAKAVRETLSKFPNYYQETNEHEAELAIISPGLNPRDYLHLKCPIIPEIEFAQKLFRDQNYNPKIIGVTGTNGKSTTTALIAHLLNAPTAGNIGIPLISFVPTQKTKNPPSIIVVELSSYQLETIKDFYVDIAILLNLTPDHLQRHITMENYKNAKLNIVKNATKETTVIYNHKDTYFQNAFTNFPGKSIPIKQNPQISSLLKDFSLVGNHNIFNATASILAALELNTPLNTLEQKMKSFQGLEHRIERVLTVNNKTYYNDSKGTNPEASIIAVNAFTSDFAIILGGELKENANYDLLFETLKEKNVPVLIFSTTKKYFENLANQYKIKIAGIFNTLDEVVNHTIKMPEKIILFSPACASFDQYKNFEERGHHFKTLVKTISHKN